MIGVCEAMNMGKLGMDATKLAGILNTSTARCWSSDTYNPTPGVMENVPSSRDYEGGLDHTHAQRSWTRNESSNCNRAWVHMGKSAEALYTKLCEDDELARKDFGVVFKHLKERQTDPMEE